MVYPRTWEGKPDFETEEGDCRIEQKIRIQ
jgi:hypothetical protein